MDYLSMTVITGSANFIWQSDSGMLQISQPSTVHSVSQASIWGMSAIIIRLLQSCGCAFSFQRFLDVDQNVEKLQGKQAITLLV